jgi:hypothetical protein
MNGLRLFPPFLNSLFSLLPHSRIYGSSLMNNGHICNDACGSSGFHPARFSLLNSRYFGSGFAGLG